MLYAANAVDHKELNDIIRASDRDCRITGCCGQRFIAAGMKDKNIVIDGVPGNALGRRTKRSAHISTELT